MKSAHYVYIAIGVLALVALFFFFAPKNTVAPPTQKVFTLKVVAKKLVSGPDVLRANEGDQVTINITSDQAEELHLHGYDKAVELTPNVPAELTFAATLTGQFPYELENSKTEIGTLEVLPR